MKKQQQQPLNCPNCGQAVPSDYKGSICATCGADLLTGEGADLTAAEVHALQTNSFKDIDLQFQIFELKQELRQANKSLTSCSEDLNHISRLIGSICTCAAIVAFVLIIWFFWSLDAYLTASVLLK